MMDATEARETVENLRRRKLHAQIGALEARLEELSGPNQRHAWLTRIKLKQKIERLYRDLNQPVFVQMGGR